MLLCNARMTELATTIITVPQEHAGKRLDQFLATQLVDVSRARVQELIAFGKVLVNGTRAKPSIKLRG